MADIKARCVSKGLITNKRRQTAIEYKRKVLYKESVKIDRTSKQSRITNAEKSKGKAFNEL